jgi:hypothetical protein
MTQTLATAAAPLCLTATGQRREYSARLIRAGRIRNAANEPGPFVIPAEVIRQAVTENKFHGLATFVDHAGWFDNPSLRNLAGISLDCVWNEEDQSADATIRIYNTPAGDIIASLFDQVLDDARIGEPVPDVGLSLVFYPKWKPRDNHDDPLVLSHFRHIESVDFVFQPAADGRVREALESLSALGQNSGSAQRSQGQAPQDTTDLPFVPSRLRGDESRHATQTERSNQPMSENLNTQQAPAQTLSEPESAQDAGLLPVSPTPSPVDAWGRALIEATRDALVANSGLPPAAQARLRAMDFQTPEEVTAAIELQRAILADLHANDVVQVGSDAPRGGVVSLGRTSLEQVEAALEAMVEGVHPPSGVQPLTGIREFYTLMSGDYEMTGRFHSDRVSLANVTSSTMAGLVANALNKRIINLFQTYPRWWDPIVVEEDFTTLQQVKWITLGGVGELPTVSEGAAYTELTWDDQTETADFVKKGGYLGLTLEAMDKDDTRRLRAAPRALAQAAWLTLSKLVSNIFTDNSGIGPTMADTGALFNATATSSTGGHANLLTTALSYSQWQTVRIAMMKQPELNSDERLGFLTAPKYCLVPIDLEATALEIFASEGEPGTANNDENLYSHGNSHTSRMQSARSRVVVVPLWTDTNNWAAVADPRLYPSIGIGYRYGRQPEIFSVASPTAGLMFSNDTLPVKVRFFVAVGPTDWRGLHKSNVS